MGSFDVDLTIEFFRGFVNHAGVTLHIDNLRGINAHHQCETVFKAFGRARAWRWNWIRAQRHVPSTKSCKQNRPPAPGAEHRRRLD